MILRVDLFQVVDGYMGVDLRGFKGLMAEHLLEMPDRAFWGILGTWAFWGRC